MDSSGADFALLVPKSWLEVREDHHSIKDGIGPLGARLQLWWGYMYPLGPRLAPLITESPLSIFLCFNARLETNHMA